MSRARDLGVATVAALTATLGDVLLLLVANSLRPELRLEDPPGFVLPLGGFLGVVAIPLYALGYRSIAGVLRPASRPLSRAVLISGSGAAALGALIHALTAVSIRASLVSGGPGPSPVAAIATPASPLLALWLAASALVLVASAAMALATTSRYRSLPRRFSWLNPAVLSVLLAVAGLPWEVGRSFLLPAAPNLAHVLFFAASRRAAGRAEESGAA